MIPVCVHACMCVHVRMYSRQQYNINVILSSTVHVCAIPSVAGYSMALPRVWTLVQVQPVLQ